MPSPPPFQGLHRLDRSSPNFHDQLDNILYGEEYQRCMQNLQGGDLIWLIDYLDKALDGLDLSSHASRKCLRELRSICGTGMTLPASYTIPSNLLNVDPEPFACGGFGDVHHGNLDGSAVCIKRVRVYTGDNPQDATKSFYQEAIMWKRLTHPNILSLLGITITPLQLISNWMLGGDLPGFIKKHPDADRLKLLSDVTKGLCYLHSCNMIHGDLKGQNVLVDDSGRAHLADFGLATITQNLDSLRSASIQRGYSPRWTAPEVLQGGELTKEADIFSFAMVATEIFSGTVPFNHTTSMMAMVFIMDGDRPLRPTPPSFTSDLWTMTQRCWDNDPLLRPTISEVIAEVLTVSIRDRLISRAPATHERISPIVTLFLGNGQVGATEHLSQDDAQILIDAVYEVLDDDGLPSEIRRECLRNLYGFCGHRSLLPGSLKIPLCYDPNANPLRHDEFGDVWKGRHNGREVAAKVLRVYSTSDFEKTTKRFCKEVVGWRSLHHPNVVSLLGFTMSKTQFVMVSDWMENGDINEFVKGHVDVDKLGLLRDAAKGLVYMHGRGLVHGNICGSSVLIDNNGHARLANFGLLTIISDNPTVASTAVGATLAYWMSPELLVPETFGLEESRPTKASDCYALGMMVYEVLSGQTPLNQHPPVVVVLKVLEGERPERPQGARGVWFTDDIWATLELCWKHQPCDRIDSKAILWGLERNSRPVISGNTQELPDGVHPAPRPYDSRGTLVPFVSSTTRPLPVAGNLAMPSTSHTSLLAPILPSNEPEPKLRSAMGNIGTSPRVPARIFSPGNQQDSNDQTRLAPSVRSRYTRRVYVIENPIPPTPNSDEGAAGAAHERGIGNAVLREPPSPATPSSPRHSPSSESSPRGITSPVDKSSTESTSESRLGYPSGDFAGKSTTILVPSEPTLTATKKERLDTRPLPQRPAPATIGKAHPYLPPPPLPLPPYPPPSSDGSLAATSTTSSMSASHAQLPVYKPIPQPQTSTPRPTSGPLKQPPSDDDSGSESDASGTLWAIRDNTKSTFGTRQTYLQSDRGTSLPRLIVDPGVSQHQQQKPLGKSGTRSNNRTGVFNEDFRPTAAEMYDRLGDFFPEHDLDKPVIEGSSAGAGTSPTPAGAAQLFPTPDRQKHKKSIRVVANEHKRKLERTSRITSLNNANMLRKRSTKLWGSRVEEVTFEQNMSSAPSTSVESFSEPKQIFKWVRGELIGEGTYGEVYVALNATTGEMIAVKQVEIRRMENRKNSRHVTVVEALKLESETLEGLDHQNIVQYLGFEETPRYLSIFLEYVPGGSIASILRKSGRFNENVTKSFTAQILDGLDYLHARGIIHRDLKADNILVEELGICKIADFGISKRTDNTNMIGAHTSMQGTVFWMAPEVINNQERGYNSKIDIWSVGCVVLEMWTGERPWNGRGVFAVLFQLHKTGVGPLLPKGVDLSPQADDLRKRCFAMNPDERPTAGELRQHQYLVLPPGWKFSGFQ